MSMAYKILGQRYVGLTQTIIPGTSGSVITIPGAGYYGYYGGGGGDQTIVIDGTPDVVVESLEYVTLYTVPVGTQAIISSIFAVNHDTVTRTYDLAIVPSGETLAVKHHVRWDYPIDANDFDMFSEKLTLSAGDKIVVLPSTADKIGFTAFGVEVSV